MPSGTRSTRGCWTCRIRKKKCDEAIPECYACTNLGIQCHKFDQKPDWLDGGQRERGGLERIKQAVKESITRKAAVNAAERRRKRKRGNGASEEESPLSRPDVRASSSILSENGDSRLADSMPGSNPKILSPSVLSSETITVLSPSASSQSKPEGLFHESPSTTHNLASLNLFAEEEVEAQDGRSTPPRVLADHRDRLLMHFIDYVFPIEFPFYNPSFWSGRGWLLTLLIRTRPLYHAALSISAYHHSALNKARYLKCKILTWKELQAHHTLALKELHDVMKEIDQGGGAEEQVDFNIQALATVVQMIAFELFVGGAEIWKTHLKAANVLFTSLLGPPATCRQAWGDIDCAVDSLGHKQYSANDVAAKFLSAVLVWFDILSCISTGSSPVLHEYHEPLLTAPGPLIELDHVMGCNNEVMMLISRVAKLEAWKSECREEGMLSNAKLVMKAAGIEEGLETTVNRLGKEISQARKPVSEVSQLFATAALVYLHVVVSGFQSSLPEIEENVARALRMFKALSDKELIRSLAWPLCITGCLAGKEQEEEFKGLMLGMSAEVFLFGSARDAYKIMEKSWERREDRDDGWTWAKCMNSLGHLVLVI